MSWKKNCAGSENHSPHWIRKIGSHTGLTLSKFWVIGGVTNVMKEKLRRQWKPLPTLIKKSKVTLVPSTVKLLYQQTTKAQSERSNRVPDGGKKSQRDWSTSLKQARAPGKETAELSKGSTRDDHPSRPLPASKTTESHSQTTETIYGPRRMWTTENVSIFQAVKGLNVALYPRPTRRA